MRYGVPDELAALLERLLPGGENAQVRYQLRQAARTAMMWENDEVLNTSAVLTPAQRKAKDAFVTAFRAYMDTDAREK